MTRGSLYQNQLSTHLAAAGAVVVVVGGVVLPSVTPPMYCLTLKATRTPKYSGVRETVQNEG